MVDKHGSPEKTISPEKQSLRKRLRARFERIVLPLTVGLIIFLIFLAYLAPSILVSIYPGQAGVLWRRFSGTDLDTVFSEGLRAKFPWDVMYIYDLRLQEQGEEFNVLSKDGLSISVFISVRFRLIKRDLPDLHKHIGPNYLEVLLMPEIGSHARQQIALYSPEELYTTKRALVQEAILDRVRAHLQVQFDPDSNSETLIHVEDVNIRNIDLPEEVEAAIKSKLAQLHMMLEYDYKLLKEEKEAERKAIEATGIRMFQDIVSEGISDRYLKWKGIDATLELAQSNNSKIVIIGGGEDGLPIILGPLDANSTDLSATVPPAADAQGNLQ